VVLLIIALLAVVFLHPNQSNQLLVASNESLYNVRANVVSHMQTGYIFLNSNHRITDMNATVLTMVKGTMSSLLGKPISHLEDPLFQFIHASLTSEKNTQQSIYMHKSHYLHSYYLIKYSDVFEKNNQKSGTSILITDISELQHTLNQLEYIGNHDDLTGANNRYHFQQQLLELENSDKLPIAIVVGDINGLKLVNDTLGHSSGDSLLVEAVEQLYKVFPKDSSICRIGGDEFVVLLPNVDEELLTYQIKQLENYHFKNYCNDLTIGLALDYSIKYDSTKTLEQVFNEADANMYLKKLLVGSSMRDNNIQLLQKILSGKSIETSAHLNRTAHLAKNFALELNLDNTATNDLILLSQLHDIGKTIIPDDILFKPTKLNGDEWHIMKTHSQQGFEIVQCSPSLKSVGKYILHHHEHYDGKGYPANLVGDEIPYLSRIIAIVDAYDAMTSKRIYKEALHKEEAIKELHRCMGSQFDPDLCQKFIHMISRT